MGRRKGECDWAGGQGPQAPDLGKQTSRRAGVSSVEGDRLGRAGSGNGKGRGKEDYSNLKLIRIHIPRRITTFLCYLILIYFK